MASIETTVTSFDVDHMRGSIVAAVAPTLSGPKMKIDFHTYPNLMQFVVMVIVQPCQTRCSTPQMHPESHAAVSFKEPHMHAHVP